MFQDTCREVRAGAQRVVTFLTRGSTIDVETHFCHVTITTPVMPGWISQKYP